MGTGIAVVLNVVYLLINLAGVGGEAVANIPVRSMAIAKLPTWNMNRPMVPVTMDQSCSHILLLDDWIEVNPMCYLYVWRLYFPFLDKSFVFAVRMCKV